MQTSTEYNVVLYKDGVRHSIMTFGHRCRMAFSRGRAYVLAANVRADKKFVDFVTKVEPTF